jgi:serine/threonine protein kinase
MLSGDESAQHASLIGTTLGNYVIERELGRGGMGAVYVGVHKVIGKRAAIKVLLPEISQRAEAVQRFVREARAATAVRHPGIVEVFEYGVGDEGHAFIVMEHLDGESLAARLKSHGQLPVPQAISIARQIAAVLSAAHKAGIVHRDLKPDNVFLVPDEEVSSGERVKLLDFGVAKLIDQPQQVQTVTGAILGTPQYMSPEQCEGARVVDHRSDLYSLGCTLFQMLTGRLPFVVGGVGGMIGAHLHTPPPHVREHNPAVSEALDAIVDRLLAKSPDDRYPSADDVASALSDPATGAITRPQEIPATPVASLRPTQRPTVGSPTRPDPAAALMPTQADGSGLVNAPTRDVRPTRVEPDREQPRRRSWLLPVVGIAVAAAAGITAFVLLRAPEESPSPAIAPQLAPEPSKPEPLTDGQARIKLLETALAKHDYTDAGNELAKLAKLDDAAARAKADQLKTTHHAAAIAAAVPEIEKLRDAGKCDDARHRADAVAATWGADDALATAAMPCSAKPVAKVDSRPADPARPDPAKPVPEPNGNARALHDQALLAAFAAKQYGNVLTMCRTRPPDRPTLFKACLVSACMQDRLKAALAIMAIPSDKAGNSAKTDAMNDCRAAGHDLIQMKNRAVERAKRRPGGRPPPGDDD